MPDIFTKPLRAPTTGVACMHELLSSYWWEFKNHDNKAYVNSCNTCAKCKGNYSKYACWSIGHCKQGKRPFELVFIDFVTMPNSKGKLYIRTFLDSFDQHFTAIIYCMEPCNRCCSQTVPIFSPPQRNTSRSVLRSWHTLYG